jgi:hypothetical protein
MPLSSTERARRYRETHKDYLSARAHLEREIAKSERAIQQTAGLIARADLDLPGMPPSLDRSITISLREMNVRSLVRLEQTLADERDQLERLKAMHAVKTKGKAPAAPDIDIFS